MILRHRDGDVKEVFLEVIEIDGKSSETWQLHSVLMKAKFSN